MKALAKTFIPTVQLFFGKIQLSKSYVAKINFPKISPVYENPGRTRILPNKCPLFLGILRANFVLGILLGIKLGITRQSAFLLGITWQLASVPGNCVQNVLGTKHN